MKPKPGRKNGRPSLYSIQLVEKIAARLSTGEPLDAICRDSDMPSRQTVDSWRLAKPEVSRLIARGRDIGYDAIATEALTIADDLSDDPASRRVRCETRLKLLAKWDPKRYGDRVEVEHGVTEGTAASLGAWLKSHMPAQIVRPAPPMIEDEPPSD